MLLQKRWFPPPCVRPCLGGGSRRPRVRSSILLCCIFCEFFRFGSAKDILKGISYGPAPLKGPGKLLDDDFMSDSASALWGPTGRGDLAIIAQLGANAVRLYGDDVGLQHKGFLDEAMNQNLGVIAGLSDYAYIQMPGNCLTTNYDCSVQIKDQYSKNLLEGSFLGTDKKYHPALRALILINEPDLKMGGDDPQHWCRSIISAFDGALSAEVAAGIKDPKLNFTVTMSFGTCPRCSQGHGLKPSLGQMLEVKYAMQYPHVYGYTPKNDIWTAYKARFMNSFNTHNLYNDISRLFLDDYNREFQGWPVFIGEYHSAGSGGAPDQKADLTGMLSIAEDPKNLLIGLSFFEFQRRYDKKPEEQEYGMWGLGDVPLKNFTLGGIEYTSWCLVPEKDGNSGEILPTVVAQAFGGHVVDYPRLCAVDPAMIILNEVGFVKIAMQESVDEMSVFATRVVEHMGGFVHDPTGLAAFAAKYVATPGGRSISGRYLGSLDTGISSLAKMEKALDAHPGFATWDPYPACIADRSSDMGLLTKWIDMACGYLDNRADTFNCSTMPRSCSHEGDNNDPSQWRVADYIFSVYFSEVGGSSLSSCYMLGSAILNGSATYRRLDPECVVSPDPATTPMNQDGYRRIRLQQNEGNMEVFIVRVVAEFVDSDAKVGDKNALWSLASHPPLLLDQLMEQVMHAPWLCDGRTGRDCNKGAEGFYGLSPWTWVIIAASVLFLIAVLIVAIKLRKRIRQRAAVLERQSLASLAECPEERRAARQARQTARSSREDPLRQPIRSSSVRSTT